MVLGHNAGSFIINYVDRCGRKPVNVGMATFVVKVRCGRMVRSFFGFSKISEEKKDIPGGVEVHGTLFMFGGVGKSKISLTARVDNS